MHESLSTVELTEDPISTFFSLSECPKVLQLPTGVDPATGEVFREQDGLGQNLTEVRCRYAREEVDLKAILDDIFFEKGRVRPHERILCWFPKYVEYYSNTRDAVVGKSSEAHGDVLPLDQKLYLGIMAVSCYHCDYLLNMLEEEFVLEGGDLTWITEGLQRVDPRLARF